jgi:hypothetical protein
LCFLGFLSFVVYFEWWSLEQGSGVHWMSHPCSDGVYGGIEWLFQLKGDGGIEIVFQWFKVQCKMKRMHETCKTMMKQMNTKKHEPNGRNA